MAEGSATLEMIVRLHDAEYLGEGKGSREWHDEKEKRAEQRNGHWE